MAGSDEWRAITHRPRQSQVTLQSSVGMRPATPSAQSPQSSVNYAPSLYAAD